MQTLILLIGAIGRLYSLQNVPPGLSQDEVLNADIVERIWDGRHALFFAEGFGHEPLYHYYAALFQPLFGDNLLSIRLPAVFLGLILISLTMRYTRREWGRFPAIITGGMMAVSWWPIIFSRIGLRPILEPVLLMLAMLNWMRRPILTGILIGLLCYTYTPAVPFLILPILCLRRGHLAHGLRITAVALLTYLPLAFYLWHNPDLLERGEQLGGVLAELQGGNIAPLWHNIVQTVGAFGLTGDPRWSYGIPDMSLVEGGASLWLILGLIYAIRNMTHWHHRALLLWWLVGLIPSIVTPDAPSSIRMIGALCPTYILIGISIKYVETRHIQLIIALCLVGGSAARTSNRFIEWPTSAEVRIEKYQSIWLDIAQDYKQQQQDNLIPVISESSYAPIDNDSFVRNLGRDPAARWVQGGNALVIPATHSAESIILYVPEYAPVQPALFEAVGIDPAAPTSRILGTPGFATYSLSPPDSRQNWGALNILFGDTLMLKQVIVLDDDEAVITVWAVQGEVAADVNLFLHGVTPGETEPRTQSDAFDAIPSQLRPGDIFLQYHTFPAVDQPLRLMVGVYERTSGQRWQVTGSNNQPVDIWDTGFIIDK